MEQGRAAVSQPRHAFAPLLGHEVHVTLWGKPSNKPIVMWHGLARTGRDFDELARTLSETHFVLCPDTIGRGLSSWSGTPEEDYSVAHMSRLALALLDHYQIEKTGWLGTSMGGLIGMALASGPEAERLSYLMINDIGPEVPQDAIDRIRTYTGDLPVFDTVVEAGDWLRRVYAPFGPAPADFWEILVRSSLRRRSDGRLTLHYDPAIVRQFTHHADELNTWENFARIEAPCHVFAGARSDVLLSATLDRMQATGPLPSVTVFEECGHAPALARPEDAELVRRVIGALEGA